MANESGLSATVNAGGTPQTPNPLEDFAKQMMQIREQKRQTSLQSLDAAFKMADYDPEVAASFAKQGGLKIDPKIFQAKHEEAQAAKAHAAAMAGIEENKGTADVSRINAETDQAKAGAAASQSDVAIRKQQLEEAEKIASHRDAAQAVLDNPETPPDKRAAAAVSVAEIDKVPVDLAKIMMMPPKMQADYVAHDASKATADSVQAEFKTAGIISDIRDKNGNPLTPEQQKAVISGQPLPKGFDTPEQRQLLLQARQVAAEESRATSENKVALSTEFRNVSQAMLDIAKAQHEDMLAGGGGKGTTPELENILKGFEAAKGAELSGDKKTAAAVRERLSKQLQANYGLVPDEVKSLFGLWSSSGYSFIGDMPDKKATKGQSGGPAGDQGASLTDLAVVLAATRDTLETAMSLPANFGTDLAKLTKSLTAQAQKTFSDFMNAFLKNKPQQ